MIKSDINLLPKKKRLPASITVGIPLGVVLLAVLLSIGIILPKISLSAKKLVLADINEQLKEYVNTENEYQMKLLSFKKLENQKKSYNDFINADAQTLNLFTKINSVKQTTITLEEYVFSPDMVSIRGFATTDIEIARFEVALRKISIFPEISLGNINGDNGRRNFIFTLMNKVAAVESQSNPSSSATGSSAISSSQGGE